MLMSMKMNFVLKYRLENGIRQGICRNTPLLFTRYTFGEVGISINKLCNVTQTKTPF